MTECKQNQSIQSIQSNQKRLMFAFFIAIHRPTSNMLDHSSHPLCLIFRLCHFFGFLWEHQLWGGNHMQSNDFSFIHFILSYSFDTKIAWDLCKFYLWRNPATWNYCRCCQDGRQPKRIPMASGEKMARKSRNFERGMYLSLSKLCFCSSVFLSRVWFLHFYVSTNIWIQNRKWKGLIHIMLYTYI